MRRVLVAVKTTEGGRWIIPQIRALRNRGVEVIVLLPHGDGRLSREVLQIVAEDSGVRLVRSSFDFNFRPHPLLPWQLYLLRRQVKQLRPDACLYHLYATALAIRIVTRGMKLRRVHMVAGPLYLESATIRRVERFFARLDDHIICGSNYTYIRYRQLGVPARMLTVIPYGVSVQRFTPATDEDRTSARRDLGIEPGTFVAVMISYVYAPKQLTFSGQGIKGHDVLLRAWERFHEAEPDTALVLVGHGFDAQGEAHRQALLRSMGRSLDNAGIRWLESVDDVRWAYRAADVSVSPSRSDNHGAALEASAMGVPCIVSDAGALPEAIPPNAGWIHRAGSAEQLERNLHQALDAKRCGQLEAQRRRARRWIEEQFDSARLTEKVVDTVVSS